MLQEILFSKDQKFWRTKMAKELKELFLEILSEENSPQLSPLANDSDCRPKQWVAPDTLSKHIPSPLVLDPANGIVEEKGNERKSLQAPSLLSRKSVISGKERNNGSQVCIGLLKNVNEQGHPLVEFFENHADAPIYARSIISVGKEDLGKEVVLMFEQGDVRKPIIMGILQSSGENPSAERTEEKSPSHSQVNVDIDGERMTLAAQKEIVLRCGKASITLTKAGKILIKGEYVLARAMGVNRIQGGSVQIN
jgi:hypothetical protein